MLMHLLRIFVNVLEVVGILGLLFFFFLLYAAKRDSHCGHDKDRRLVDKSGRCRRCGVRVNDGTVEGEL